MELINNRFETKYNAILVIVMIKKLARNTMAGEVRKEVRNRTYKTPVQRKY